VQDPSLPPELEDLERRLADRPRPEPSPDLRDRITQDVRTALAKELRTPRRKNGWTYAAAVAAMVLLWINLSMSAAATARYDLRLASGTRSVEAMAEEIQGLLPGVTRQEALRQAVLLKGGSSLTLCPKLPQSPAARDYLRELD